MLPILMLFLLFAGLTTSICVYGYRWYVRPARLSERLGAPVGISEVLDGPPLAEGKLLVRIIGQIGEKVPASPQDVSIARRSLMAAGYRSEKALHVYYGVKIVTAVAAFIAMIFLRDHFTSSGVLSVVLLFGAPAAGWAIPGVVLDRMITKRQTRLRLSLPDALDLIVICMEAGLGLDQAIVNVARELELTHADISGELSLVTMEMRAGKRRSDALKNLAERTGEAELRKLVATLVQADRFGTGVGEALRTHSEFMRVRRRQIAEERAAKVGVKLVFPIFFFILPAMLVTAAGPGLLQLFKNLFPMMSNFE